MPGGNRAQDAYQSKGWPAVSIDPVQSLALEISVSQVTHCSLGQGLVRLAWKGLVSMALG